MPRLPRFDRPGSWHHVMNRGIARRTVFERRADVRAFLALLACEVRRGTIEVHAFAILTTHVHLLVRSPRGELARAMKRVFNGYVRYFNRGRRRDGSLFRGRYRSRVVDSRAYRLLVLIYIDQNAVQAELAANPHAYPHGSAYRWARGRLPPWLARDWILDVLGIPDASPARAAQRYRTAFAGAPDPDVSQVIEGRLAHRQAAEDPLDDLLGAAPARVLEWMVRKAALADQTRPGLPLVPVPVVLATWRRHREELHGVVRGRRGPGRPLCDVACTALLRDLCGLTHERIAAHLETSRAQAAMDYRRHAALLGTDRRYARVCRAAAVEALAAVFGCVPHGRKLFRNEPGSVRRVPHGRKLFRNEPGSVRRVTGRGSRRSSCSP